MFGRVVPCLSMAVIHSVAERRRGQVGRIVRQPNSQDARPRQRPSSSGHVDENARQLILRSQCIPELLQPEDIADVVLFLASQASRALTGQEILADRGWHHS